MGHLQALIDAYLDSQGGMAPAALARKMGTTSSTLSSWKKRGSRPSPALLRSLSVATGIDHLAFVAAVDADAGDLTVAELSKILSASRLTPAMRDACLRAGEMPPPTRTRRGA